MVIVKYIYRYITLLVAFWHLRKFGSKSPSYTQGTVRCNTRTVLMATISTCRGEMWVTQQQYYSFHMIVRDGNYLLQGAHLFQQYLVDA